MEMEQVMVRGEATMTDRIPSWPEVERRAAASEPLDRIIAQYLIGQSPAIRRVRALVARLAPTGLPIHIHGPTGSGKELVARAIHAVSRRTGKLVSLNVCAIADGVFEATLFGHVRGAFTGAVADSDGMLLEANDGTVFLDEISGLGLASQAKLLRAIELREFRPVGGRRDRVSRFRILSATNDDLEAQTERGEFRADLLHRLRGAVIVLPSLAERPEDIGELARYFIGTSDEGWVRERQLDDAAILELTSRDWPGNVRELRLVVECAAALSDQTRIGRVAVREAIDIRRTPSMSERARSDGVTRELISALAANGWDVDGAAARLGIHRATAYRKLRKAGYRSSGSALDRVADQ